MKSPPNGWIATPLAASSRRRKSDGLVFIGNGDRDLLFEPLDGGARTTLLRLPYETLFTFALSPDGEQIAYTSGLLTSDAVLFQNSVRRNDLPPVP